MVTLLGNYLRSPNFREIDALEYKRQSLKLPPISIVITKSYHRRLVSRFHGTSKFTSSIVFLFLQPSLYSSHTQAKTPFTVQNSASRKRCLIPLHSALWQVCRYVQCFYRSMEEVICLQQVYLPLLHLGCCFNIHFHLHEEAKKRYQCDFFIAGCSSAYLKDLVYMTFFSSLLFHFISIIIVLYTYIAIAL